MVTVQKKFFLHQMLVAGGRLKTAGAYLFAEPAVLSAAAGPRPSRQPRELDMTQFSSEALTRSRDTPQERGGERGVRFFTTSAGADRLSRRGEAVRWCCSRLMALAASFASRRRWPRIPADPDRPARPCARRRRRRLAGASRTDGHASASSSPATSPSSPLRSTWTARSGRLVDGRDHLGHVLTVRPPAASRRGGGRHAARVLNDEEWHWACRRRPAARSAAIRDDFESFALAAGRHLRPAVEAAPTLSRLGEREFAPTPTTIAALWASLVRQDVRALLERIRTRPGRARARSRLYGDDTADHLVAALPHARAYLDARATPHLEQPSLFNATFRDFAERLSRAAPPKPRNLRRKPFTKPPC